MCTIGRSAAICLAVGITAAGQQDSAADLTKLAVEDLLNLRVISATKVKAMTARRSPGAVRVFTRQDIERYGFVTLRDVLANIPGTQIQEYRIGHQSVWIRGIKQRYNNKILWLIDGTPIRDPFYGHTHIDEVLPLYVVERIEVIHGPGGVLYGSNAFSGIVSITTRRDGRTMRFNAGSFRTVGGGVEASGGGVYAAADVQSSGGFHPLLNSDGNAYRHPQDRDRVFALLKAERGAFRSSFGYTRHRFADAFRKAGDNRFWRREPVYGSAGFDKEIGGRLSLGVLGYYQDYDLARDKTKYTATGAVRSIDESQLGGSLYGVDITGSWKAGAHTILIGSSMLGDRSGRIRESAVFPVRGSAPGIAAPAVHRHNVGTLVQDIWSLSEYVDLTVGARYDYLSDFKDQVSYRIGLTGQKGLFYGKLLYGTAFRVPSYREYLDPKSFNFSLRPEHLNTAEVQAGIAFSRGDASVTFYNNHYRDLIREVFVTEIRRPGGTLRIDDEYSINAGRSTLTGLEFQASIFPTGRMTASLGLGTILRARERVGALDHSLLRLSARVEEGEAPVLLLARYTGNALWSYQLSGAGHRAGVNAFWMSGRNTPPEYQTTVPVANRNPANARGFARLDAFTTIPVSGPLALNLKATNLLGRRIYSPPLDDPSDYDIEWAGRAFRFELVWRF